MRDVLDRDARARRQRDETVPQLSWCPLLRQEPSVFGHLAEGTPNVGRIERVQSCVVKTRSLRAIVPRCACDSGSASVLRSKCNYTNHPGVGGCAATVASWYRRFLAPIATTARSAASAWLQVSARKSARLLAT